MYVHKSIKVKNNMSSFVKKVMQFINFFTDIYSKFIAPMFNQKLFVQTWREKLDDDQLV